MRQLGCCKSCARIPKLHRKILNSNSRTLPAAQLLAFADAVATLILRERGGCEELVRVEGDPKINFFFHFCSTLGSTSLDNVRGISSSHYKKKKKEFGEIKKLRYRQSHESSIILLPGMSRSRLFTLTSATSNLCLGLILAFQRHRIWPYHPVRVVFVVSPRAVIECGM